jgi:large subunit ribosomal protein LP0
MSGAASGSGRKERKDTFFAKLNKLLDEYTKILVVGADNVGSNHMQRIRLALRGKGVLLMGKNTMVRKVLRTRIASTPAYEALLPYVYANVGFVFTNADLSQVRESILSLRVAAPAKTGAIAPNDVIVPAGNTGMEPTQTSFLQALNIPSKIAKGQIEIVNDVHLITKGQKVGSSEAALLAKLNIRPFSYGLTITGVYDDGSVFEPELLDMTDNDVLKAFSSAVQQIVALSLYSSHLTLPAVPNAVIVAYKDVLAAAVETNTRFERSAKFLDYLENPDAFKAAAPAASAAAPAAAAGKKEEPKKEEAKEESDGDMGFGLFD